MESVERRDFMIKPYFETENGKLFHGCCLEIMKDIPDKSIDMILCDLPYGVTNCKWDNIIALDNIWLEYKRLLKLNRMVVLTAGQPFASFLICSNLKWFKYDLIWEKSHATGFLNANVCPLRSHETILIFSNGKMIYNPQLSKKSIDKIRPPSNSGKSDCYNSFFATADRTIPDNMAYPKSIIKINSPNHGEKGLHPTQKPIALFRYLILTYTNKGDTVLDNCIGSGTTAVAAETAGRKWIGIEKDENYCQKAAKRIRTETRQLTIT